MSSPGPGGSSTSSSSSGSNWTTWAVVGTASCVAIAGLGYLAYSFWTGDEDADKAGPSNSQQEAATRAKLSVARGLQMQALAPSARSAKPARAAPKLPARTAPKLNGAKGSTPSTGPGSKAGGPGAGGSSGGNRRVCGNCNQPLASGLPLRCSGCKQVYYCSQECQRKAWPAHRASCKAASSAASTPAKDGTSSPTAQQASPRSSSSPGSKAASSGGAAEIVPEGSGAGLGQGRPKQEPQSFQAALAEVLQQQAASNSDKVESSFELAVMLFVKGEYRAAITQLQAVQELAKERGNTSVQGEVYKWLGHAHNRLADTSKAEALFTEGVEFARKHDLRRLQIDCLGGLGCMYRGKDQAAKAVALLEQALALCSAGTSAEDTESKATTLCNLGSALMAIDPSRGLDCLQQAVEIREAAIERLHDAGERNGLATAVMEHASALVNLASALLVTRRLAEAEAAFVRALEVFELVEDVDKVVKVLVNLANMNELQVSTPAAYESAAKFRNKLLAFLDKYGLRRADTQCTICLEPIALKEVTSSADQQLIMLSCLHCLHNKCWEKWMEQKADGVTCPTCNQPVPVFAVDPEA